MAGNEKAPHVPQKTLAKSGNVIGNGIGKVGDKFEEASVALGFIPELGDIAGGIFKAIGTGFDVAGRLANFKFRESAHSAVSGLTAAVTREAEALVPFSGDVDGASRLVTGKAASKNFGDAVADKLVGKDGKAKEIPPHVLKQAREAVKGQPGEGPNAEQMAESQKTRVVTNVDISPGILDAKVSKVKFSAKELAGIAKEDNGPLKEGTGAALEKAGQKQATPVAKAAEKSMGLVH